MVDCSSTTRAITPPASPGIGWVDQGAVGPAGDPGTWVTNHRATPLWSGVDDKAARFNDLPQWTKLRLVDSALPDAKRVEVQFFGDGATRQPGIAWIARADIGPITPPCRCPRSPPCSQSCHGDSCVAEAHVCLEPGVHRCRRRRRAALDEEHGCAGRASRSPRRSSSLTGVAAASRARATISSASRLRAAPPGPRRGQHGHLGALRRR